MSKENAMTPFASPPSCPDPGAFRSKFMFASLWCLSLLLASIPLEAQEVTASITGTVTDPSGEVVLQANVEVVNPETGSRSAAMTGSRGEYVLTLLRPGRYQLTVSHIGFRTYQRSNIG